uniref:Uncharacterized protein n=1 Tax=Populus trichocarpa TaxID=3694 RepID=B9N021_POPTR
MDWSSVMSELPLLQRVAKTARKGWSCLFIGMHLALKGWLGRKCIMAGRPLPQRVAKTTGRGWGCLFIGMYLALNGWLGRKWPQAVDTWHQDPRLMGSASAPNLDF